MSKYVLCLGLIIFSFYLISCDDDNVTGNNDRTAGCTLSARPVLKSPEYLNDSNMTGYIGIEDFHYVVKYEEDISHMTGSSSYAMFCGEGINSGWIGYLSLDSDTMDFECLEPFDEGSAMSCNYIINWKDRLSFAARDLSCKGSGSGIISRFELKLPVPGSYFTITSPSLGQKIDKSKPLVLNWDGQHEPGANQVRITIEGMNGKKYAAGNYFTDDDGSFTIPVEDLNGYTTLSGLKIFVGRNSVLEVLPGKYIYAEIYSKYSMPLSLAE